MLLDSDNFLQIQNPMNFQTYLPRIQIKLSVWKAFFHHLSQFAISHAKMNNKALNSYSLMSIHTRHQNGPQIFIQFDVYNVTT